MLPEIRADFDRINNLINASRAPSNEASDEVKSMVNEYLCVAITGRLEQNIKKVFIAFSDRNSKKKMNTAVSRLCQSFQNPSKEKICDLVSLFDKDFSKVLISEWQHEGSAGQTISDMVGRRKVIAHQTRNNRDTTNTKIDQYYLAYKEVVARIHNHFLP